MSEISITRSTTIGKLVAALAKAQRAIKPPVKDKTGTVKGQKKDGGSYEYTYQYSDLSSLIEAIREPFAENGLIHSQVPTFDGSLLVLRTLIAHESGEWLEGSYPCGLGKPQEVGISISYARRYSLQAMAGLAAEDDPDGKHGTSTEKRKPESKPQPARTLPLSEEEEHKLANWLASLENRHGAEDLAIARKAADKLTSAGLKAKVMDAIERYAKRAAA